MRLARRAFLEVAAISVGMAACGGRGWTRFGNTRLALATGNPGGVFQRYGDAFVHVIEQRLSGVEASVRLTAASVENVTLVATGDCQLGFSLADVASDAVTGAEGFARPLRLVAMARMYDSFVHLVTRRGSGISSAGKLRGRRVGVGAPGSGTLRIARRLLHETGLTLGDVGPDHGSLATSVATMAEGRLDAFFFVSGIPNTAIGSLMSSGLVDLLDLDDLAAGMIGRHGSVYGRSSIPASTYGSQRPVQTLTVKNFLVAAPEVPDDLAYALTRVVFDARAEIDEIAPGVPQPTRSSAIFTSPLPLHPGAERYYRETQL